MKDTKEQLLKNRSEFVQYAEAIGLNPTALQRLLEDYDLMLSVAEDNVRLQAVLERIGSIVFMSGGGMLVPGNANVQISTQ